MQQIYLIIALLGFSVVSAQDPQLFENTWYLHNVIINGQSNTPHSNSEVPFIPLEFFENGGDDFMTTVCNSFFGTLLYNGNQNFTIENYAVTLTFCDLQENTTFEGIYLSFFFNPTTQNPYTEPFSCTIIVNGSERTLTIGNVNGDQAIYGDHILSAEYFGVSKFSIHPNPVNNELFLTSKNGMGNLNIKIFNIEGKLLSTENFEFEKQVSVDVSNLTSGIYFLNVEDKKGNTIIKKFVKE